MFYHQSKEMPRVADLSEWGLVDVAKTLMDAAFRSILLALLRRILY
jgi:hypothetical protein